MEIENSEVPLAAHNSILPQEIKAESYRNYAFDTPVAKFYYEQHINQTYDYVMQKKAEYYPLRHYKKSIYDIISLMDDIVDVSDPDTKYPQIYHCIQTGEALKSQFPKESWLHLTGFIHDLGKVLCHPTLQNLPQWSVVGDIFPVGCAFSEKCVYSQYFEENPDKNHPMYSTPLGIYKENVGFDNVHFAFSHDWMLSTVMKENNCSLPSQAQYIVRYHSFYPWHQHQAYSHLASEEDKRMLPWLQAFQKCDLYSKKDEEVDVKKLLPYYEDLVNRYFVNPVLQW